MTNHAFTPNNFGLTDGIIKLYFKDGDISLTIGRNQYLLESKDDTIIEYNLESKKIINNDTAFIFTTTEGLRAQYFLFQLINIKGISEAIQEFVEGSMSDDNIKFDESTNKLIEQIMDYHKEELINSHLEQGNYEELKKLSWIL